MAPRKTARKASAAKKTGGRKRSNGLGSANGSSGRRSSGPPSGRVTARGSRTRSSSSGSRGPMTTGHFSANGQRIVGGYASTGRGRAGSTLRPGIGSDRIIPGIGFPGVPGRRGGRAGENGSGLSGNYRGRRLPPSR